MTMQQLLMGGGGRPVAGVSAYCITAGQSVEGHAATQVGAGAFSTTIIIPTYTSGYVFVIFNSTLMRAEITPATDAIGGTISFQIGNPSGSGYYSTEVDFGGGASFLQIFNGTPSANVSYNTTPPSGITAINGLWAAAVFYV